jgi:hypothetical protein
VVHPERPPTALPDSLWFLDLPNIDNRPPLRALAAHYRGGPPDTIRVRGYAMTVWPLVRRPGDRVGRAGWRSQVRLGEPR